MGAENFMPLHSWQRKKQGRWLRRWCSFTSPSVGSVTCGGVNDGVNESNGNTCSGLASTFNFQIRVYDHWDCSVTHILTWLVQFYLLSQGGLISMIPRAWGVDLHTYSDTAYSDTPLTVYSDTFAVSQMIGLLQNYLWLQ